MADIYTFGLNGVYTFDWKYGLLLSWEWFDIFNQMACFTGYIICVDVRLWYIFVTLQLKPVRFLKHVEENFVHDKISRSQLVQ